MKRIRAQATHCSWLVGWDSWGSAVNRPTAESQAQSSVSRFYEKEYAIPAEVLKDRNVLTVKFEATNGLEVTPVFGVRLVKR